MGLDRFANFISKANTNDAIEELHINNNIKKIISNHIIFDINFLIYQEIIEIENEMNDLIKIILCYSNFTNSLEEILNIFLSQEHWKLSDDNFEITIISNIKNDSLYANEYLPDDKILLNNLVHKIIDKLFTKSRFGEVIKQKKKFW